HLALPDEIGDGGVRGQRGARLLEHGQRVATLTGGGERAAALAQGRAVLFRASGRTRRDAERQERGQRRGSSRTDHRARPISAIPARPVSSSPIVPGSGTTTLSSLSGGITTWLFTIGIPPAETM